MSIGNHIFVLAADPSDYTHLVFVFSSRKPADSAEMIGLKKQIETLKAENALLKNNFDM